LHKTFRKSARKVGLPPGTLLHIGNVRSNATTITVLDYDEHSCREIAVRTVEELLSFKSSSTITWIQVSGIHQIDVMEKIGQVFGLHPLTMEDILNTTHRPKLEDHGEYVHIILKMLYYQADDANPEIEQISLIIGSNYVISFLESEKDHFHQLREWIQQGKGRIRKLASDYLAYAIMDIIVDRYFIILEKLGETVEFLEDKLLLDATPDILPEIHALKTEMLFLRKLVWPIREMIGALERGQTALFQESTLIYLRDIYDHTIQVIDTLETYRDIMSGMLDIYLSSINNRLSEVMKVLTIISTIFIPLTFIAGVYGMNFKNMPELEWEWGYPLVLALMLTIGAFMLRYFKRKKWL
jgi:magnesium transporter